MPNEKRAFRGGPAWTQRRPCRYSNEDVVVLGRETRRRAEPDGEQAGPQRTGGRWGVNEGVKGLSRGRVFNKCDGRDQASIHSHINLSVNLAAHTGFVSKWVQVEM